MKANKKIISFVTIIVLLGLSGAVFALSSSKDHSVDQSNVNTAKDSSLVKQSKSLIQELFVKRDQQGGVIVYGKTSLPQGTKFAIDFSKVKSSEPLAKSDATVGVDGQFQSEPLKNNGSAFVGGQYAVTITSYFNGAWQSSAVLAQTGEDGKKLSSSTLIPDDPEFPNAAGHLEVSQIIKLDDLSAEAFAIEQVKNSKLLIKGEGRSKNTIKDVVAVYEETWAKTESKAFQVIGWSAVESAPGIWTVTLDCYDSGTPTKARWEYNSKTKAVSYLDPEAKLLSWIPTEVSH